MDILLKIGDVDAYFLSTRHDWKPWLRARWLTKQLASPKMIIRLSVFFWLKETIIESIRQSNVAHLSVNTPQRPFLLCSFHLQSSISARSPRSLFNTTTIITLQEIARDWEGPLFCAPLIFTHTHTHKQRNKPTTGSAFRQKVRQRHSKRQRKWVRGVCILLVYVRKWGEISFVCLMHHSHIKTQKFVGLREK